MAAFQKQYFRVMLEAVEQFNRAETESVLCSHLAQAIASFGYQYLCCVSAPSKQGGFDDKVLLNGWPKGWFEQYRKSNFHAHDPVAAFTRTQTNAFKWSDVPVPANNELAKSIMAISFSDYRMRHGLCVPIHSLHGYQAGISFAGFEIEDVKEANAAVQMIGIYAFNCLSNLKSTSRKPKLLSVREREVLTWTAGGKTAWDTSSILNIAEDTVNKHMTSAMRKLNVHTRAQAVAESIRLGEIIP